MLVMGIAGGSGSGKTTFANLVQKRLAGARLHVIRHDSFYKPLDHLSLPERKRINFDHPDSLDTPFLVQTIRTLGSGKTVKVPDYDYSIHTRKETYETIQPPTVLIVEGILIFADADLRSLFDVKIFVDADDDDRLMRRILRDMYERSRKLTDILDQYQATVKPMHLEFVEPSKRWADIIIPRGGRNEVGLDLVCSKLHMLLTEEATRKN